MQTNEYQVTGMSCGGCEASVRDTVAQIPGVIDIEVSAERGQLRLTAESNVDGDAVIAAVEAAGYSASQA